MRVITLSTLILSSLVSAREEPYTSESHSRTTIPVSFTVTPTTTTSPTPLPISSCASGLGNSTDPQTSLTLLSSVIAPNFAQNGLNMPGSNAGEVASLTSTNNFINWCATAGLPNTNGQQILDGSCNPAPMGAIPAVTKMPSCRFILPANLALITPHETFEIKLVVRNFATGSAVNPDTNYYGAPQDIDPRTGFIRGHVHVVIEALESFKQTTPTDPTKYAAFVKLSEAADANGYLYANVSGGLALGVYKMSTMMTSSNHQALALPVAARGSSDDVIYFVVAALAQA